MAKLDRSGPQPSTVGPDTSAAPSTPSNGGSRAVAPPAAGEDAAASSPPPVEAPIRGRGGGGLRAITSLRTFDSFREVPSYRWFFLASLGAFGGMNMQMVARGYVAYVLTGSYTALGGIALAQALTGVFFTAIGGVAADRWPKMAVIQIGQVITALMALVIGLLLLFDMLEFWHLLASAALQGAVFAIISPAWQSVIPEVVGMDRLMNAAALNMGGMNTMRLFLPALAGWLLVVVSAAWLYFIMAGGFFFCVAFLFKVTTVAPGVAPSRDPPRADGGRGVRGAIDDIVDGLRYTAGHRTILVLLLANLALSVVSMPYMIMLPGFVLDVLGGGSELLGTLYSVAAVGALVATLGIASMPNRSRGKLMLFAAAMMGVALIVFSMSTMVWLTVLTMIFIGAGQAIRQSLGTVLLQTHVDDEYRGRVMSINMMQMNLVMVGSFLAAIMASKVGPQLAIGVLAVVLLVFALLIFAFVPRVRDIA